MTRSRLEQFATHRIAVLTLVVALSFLGLPRELHVSLGPSAASAQTVDPLLAATPDANAEDPLIVAKAAELGNDPAQIFEFVRDEISFEVYRGSLRGARGTLWSTAGNALDQANLLVALLRAAGVRARYARGELPDTLASELIESMFPAVCRVVGKLADGDVPADPVNDPALLAETRDHVWVEFEEGGAFTAADPSFGTSVLGEFFTVAEESFDEMPDALRHSVKVRLNVEQIDSFGLSAGLDPSLNTVIEADFVTAELVGVPLSVVHLIDTKSSGGLVFSNLTHTYTPLLVVGEGDDTPLDDEAIEGTAYQELFTSFPLGSQFLTGVFLDVELRKPGGSPESLRHTILDRIGFAARRFGGSGVTLGNESGPAFTGSDVFTLSVIPGHSGSDVGVQEALLQTLAQRAEDLVPVVQSLPPNAQDPGSVATIQEALQLSREIGVSITRLMNDFFFLGLGLGDAFLESRLTVVSYLDSPRVVVSGITSGGDAADPEIAFSMNILRDPVQVVPAPQQTPDAAGIFNYLRVVHVDYLEGLATSLFTPDGEPVTAVAILGAAADQGIGLKLVDDETLQVLEEMSLSEDAKARITEAALNGKFVIAPEQAVAVGSKMALGWLEFDEQTGVVVGRLEDGSGGALFEYFGISNRTQEAVAPGLGVVSAFGSFIFGGFGAVLSGIPNAIKKGEVPTAQDIKLTFLAGGALSALKTYRKTINSFFFLNPGPRLKFAIAYKRTVRILAFTGAFAWGFFDPPVPDILIQAAPCEPDATPGTTPGVAVAAAPDGVLTQPVDDAQLPSAFLADVRNLGPDTDSFDLTFVDVTPGYEVTSSLATVKVPAGAAGEIGVYLKPIGALPAPGATVSFTVVATSTSDPAVTDSAVVDFVVPGVRGVLVSISPEVTSAEPGMPVAATLSLTSVGNVDEVDVTLDLATIGDVAVTGLVSPVSLQQGTTVTQDLILTPAVTAPFNSTVSATVTATFGTDLVGDPATNDGSIAIGVVPDAAGAAVEAADAARDLGREGLGSTLDALAASMTNLIGDPLDTAERSRLIALLESLIVQLEGSGLIELAQLLSEIRGAIISAGPTQVAEEVDKLGAPLRDLDAYLSGPARTEFALTLRPDSAAAQPGTPQRFDLSIINKGIASATYEPSVEGLLPGFTSQFNRPSLSLAPGQATGGADKELFLTLTPPQDELLPFDFTVSVAVAGVADSTRAVRGSFTARDTTVDVVGVTATPGVVDPGVSTAIAAKLLNVVNRPDQVTLSYRVVDEIGNPVFDSAPVPADLSVLASLETVDLGTFDTTGLPVGPYAIQVTVFGSDGLEIPGAAGEGSLFIGAPLTAELVVEPDTVPPGDSQVDVTLEIESLVDFPDPTIDLLAQVDTLATATSLAINGNIAYVCGTENITIFDVSDTSAPQVVGTFGEGLINGSGFAACQIVDGTLVVMWQVPLNARALTILVFALDNPTAPVLRTQTSANVRFLSSLFFRDGFGFISTSTVFFRFGRLVGQRGDFWSFDFTNLDNPFLLDALENFAAQPDGGPSNVNQAVAFGDNYALLSTTTSTGSAGQSGLGRLVIVDTSDPANLFETAELLIPGTVFSTGVDSLGDLLLVAGNTEGRRSTGNFNLTGELTLTTVDASDPTNPVILSTLVTNVSAGGRTKINSLGNGFFAVSGANLNGQPVLVLVDANDPLNIAFNTINTPAILQESQVVGNTLFTPSTAGLGVYDIGDVIGTRFAARIQFPRTTGVTIDPESFSIPPTAVLSGPSSDAVVWERTLNGIRTLETLSWDAELSGMQPGEARDVALGGTVEFTIASGETGQITVPAATVVSDQILALTPASRSVPPLQEAAYTVTVKNPTALAATYDLAVGGVPDAWASPLPSVIVPAGGEVDVPLALTPDLSEGVGANQFFVTALAGSGVQGAVFAEVVVDADAPVPVPEDVVSPSCGVVLTALPSAVTAGQGGEARYTVEVANTGSIATVFALQALPPAGLTAAFETSVLSVPPGLVNATQTTLRVGVPAGTAAGPLSVPVTAQGQGDCTVSDSTVAVLDVANTGVATALSPASGQPDTVFQLTVTNQGTVADSFDVALTGPLGPYYTLSSEVVVLAPGESGTVEISAETPPPALPGALPIAAQAVSQAVPAVQDLAVAEVTFPATRGLAVAFQPELIELEDPGPGLFSFNVENTGNVEGQFVATLTGVTGTTTAVVSLRDLDGSAVSQTQPFLVPGLGQASIIVDAELLGFGDVDSTVEAASQIGPQLIESDTARLRTLNVPPVADAGPDFEVVFDGRVFLDGGNSFDIDDRPAPLAYEWRFVEVPENSALVDADIQDRLSPTAFFDPDVSGPYRLGLTVFDGQLSDEDGVDVDVTNQLPLATAGRDRFFELDDDDFFELDDDNIVVLDGTGSSDPEGFLITYEWSLVSKPARSRLKPVLIRDADTPTPYFGLDVKGDYVFQLIVRDNELSSIADTVQVTAVEEDRAPPNAVAEVPGSGAVGVTVPLDGSHSFEADEDDFDDMRFSWSFVSTPPGSLLTDADIVDRLLPTASFVPDEPGDYEVELEVSDEGSSGLDSGIVTVADGNAPPNADAGDDRLATVGLPANLDASASGDPDDPAASLGFIWRLVSRPEGSALTSADILDAATPLAQVVPDVIGAYVFAVDVSDGLDSDFDNVLVCVTGPGGGGEDDLSCPSFADDDGGDS